MKLINLSGYPTKTSTCISDGKRLFVPHFSGGNISIFRNVSNNGCIFTSIFGNFSKDGYEMTSAPDCVAM